MAKVYIKILFFTAVFAIFTLYPVSIFAATPPTSTYLSTITDGLHVPVRIAVGPDGKIYVADPDKDRIQVYSPAGKLKYTVKNFMGTPLSIAVDSAGNIYVGDNRSKSVMVFGPDWQYIRKLGNGNGEFGMPGDIAVSSSTGRIYVADSKSDMIRVYNSDGSLYTSFGGHGSSAGKFNFPKGIIVDDANNEFFAVDQMFNGTEWSERIQIFDLDGNYKGVITLGASYNVKAQGIAMDSLGRIYVVNSLQGRVDVYDRSGTYLSSIGSLGIKTGQLSIPADAVVDSNNRLLITSSDTGRVVIYGIDNYTIPVDPPDIYYMLTISKTTGGNVTSSPSGINCGSDCSEGYTEGTAVMLTASADSGYSFSSWSGCANPSGNSCTMTMDADKTVTANFTLNAYTLTVSKSGAGSGIVASSPAGIDCGSNCSASYQSGTAISLTATPSLDSIFAGWSGACAGSGSCTITLNGNKTVTASFALETTPPQLTLNQPQPSVLAPPNGKMIPVAVSGTASDLNSGLKTVSYAVDDEYNKYDTTGPVTVNSDGSFSFTVNLEALRNNKDADGRIYTITVTVVDNANNSSKASVTVTVPK